MALHIASPDDGAFHLLLRDLTTLILSLSLSYSLALCILMMKKENKKKSMTLVTLCTCTRVNQLKELFSKNSSRTVT